MAESLKKIGLVGTVMHSYACNAYIIIRACNNKLQIANNIK